jgi:hypothetical protein
VSTVTLELPSHIYWKDGRQVPGVTNTLKNAGVIDYSMIPQDVLERASIRGTAVHKALHLYAEDRLDTSAIAPDYLGYVMAGIRFHEESEIAIAHAEQIVYNETHHYAGTFDLDGVIQDELWLIDYKTGKVLDGHRAQLAAYAACRPSPRRFRRACIELQEDGEYVVHQFPRNEFERDLDLFLFALAGQHQAA